MKLSGTTPSLNVAYCNSMRSPPVSIALEFLHFFTAGPNSWVSLSSFQGLLSVGFTDLAVQVENEFFEWLLLVNLVDPLARKIHQLIEVAAGVMKWSLLQLEINRALDYDGDRKILIRTEERILHGLDCRCFC